MTCDDVRTVKKIVSVDTAFISSNYNPSNFILNLPEYIPNVLSVKLLSIEIPNTSYNFSTEKGNTTMGIYFPDCSGLVSQGKSYIEVTIPDGNYNTIPGDTMSIMEVVEKSINMKILSFFSLRDRARLRIPCVNVCIDKSTGFITISSTNLFQLFFDIGKNKNRKTDWGLGYNLGFHERTYLNTTKFFHTGNAIADIVGIPYIFLKMDTMNAMKHITPNNSTVDVFAKILLYGDKNTMNFDDSSNFINKEYTFENATLINTLPVKLVDIYNNYVDLNGKNYSFTLEFTCHDLRLRYIDYDSYMKEKKIYNIDSSFRQNCNESPVDFTHSFAEPFVNVISVKMSSIELPNTFFNFSERLGNTKMGIYYPDFSGARTPGKDYIEVTIPDGNYNTFMNDPDSLMVTLEKAICKATGPFVGEGLPFSSCEQPCIDITLDNITGRLTMTCNINFILYFNNGPNNSRCADWGLGYNLGFKERIYATPTKTITAESIIDVVSTPYVLMQIDGMNQIKHISKNNTSMDVFAKIILYGDKNAVVFDDGGNFITKECKFNEPRMIQTIHPRFIDTHGNLLDLNGKHISFTLEFEYITSYASLKNGSSNTKASGNVKVTNNNCNNLNNDECLRNQGDNCSKKVIKGTYIEGNISNLTINGTSDGSRMGAKKYTAWWVDN
jgi:hypothetical protein